MLEFNGNKAKSIVKACKHAEEIFTTMENTNASNQNQNTSRCATRPLIPCDAVFSSPTVSRRLELDGSRVGNTLGASGRRTEEKTHVRTDHTSCSLAIGLTRMNTSPANKNKPRMKQIGENI